MIGPTGAVKVMVATKPVDFRKGAEGLAALVRAPAGEGEGADAPAAPAADLDAEETLRRDAMSALVNLGYALADANRAVLAAWGRGAREVDGLIRGALKDLAR